MIQSIKKRLSMKHILIKCAFTITATLVVIISCTTDPIVGPNTIINNPPIPPVQDPGQENLCAEGIISFQHQVLPIMVSACAYSGCHDAITAEDDVVLDTYENIRKEITPGYPNDSELYESIVENDPEDIMPPPPASPLTKEQISIIYDWIMQGAENTNCGTVCDPNQSSFAQDIFPLLQDYCIGCHNSARTDGNVNLENYNEIIPYVDNGSLIGTIQHAEFFIAMPPSGSKMSDCRVAQIEKWIAEGAENN